MLLVAIGLSGVMGFWWRRGREICVRMALGLGRETS
jgi:hypothetical protein